MVCALVVVVVGSGVVVVVGAWVVIVVSASVVVVVGSGVVVVVGFGVVVVGLGGISKNEQVFNDLSELIEIKRIYWTMKKI